MQALTKKQQDLHIKERYLLLEKWLSISLIECSVVPLMTGSSTKKTTALFSSTAVIQLLASRGRPKWTNAEQNSSWWGKKKSCATCDISINCKGVDRRILPPIHHVSLITLFTSNSLSEWRKRLSHWKAMQWTVCMRVVGWAYCSMVVVIILLLSDSLFQQRHNAGDS